MMEEESQKMGKNPDGASGRTAESGKMETDGGGVGVAGLGGAVVGENRGVVGRAGAADCSVSRSSVDSGGKISQRGSVRRWKKGKRKRRRR